MLRRNYLLFLLLFVSGCGSSSLDTTIVRINDEELVVDVAQTPSQLQQGLGGRLTLAEGKGMLFVFSEPRPATFWMKDMHFPIDIIWIDNTTITGIHHSVPVPTSTVLLRYHSPGTVNRVLEVPAGWALSRGVSIGDSVVIEGP